MAATDLFLPEWASAPGETIADILEERNLSTGELARALGQSTEFVDNLLRGDAVITEPIAEKLSDSVGATSAFWLRREEQFRSDLARQQHTADAAAGRQWLRAIPIRDMLRFGWVRPVALSSPFQSALEFFGVASVDQWQTKYGNALQTAAFRTSPSFPAEAESVAAWLRQGEIEANAIDCLPWDPDRFRALLQELRGFTRRKDPDHFVKELKRRCAECGVAVVIVRAPSGCRASGATRFFSSTKAILQLSFRYLSDDQFWFSFFHEAGHLLLHPKEAVFLEGEGAMSTKQEEEANEFAASVLMPPQFHNRLRTVPLRARDLIRLALQAGVSPGIIVGQLHHTGRIPPHRFNRLRRRYRWID